MELKISYAVFDVTVRKGVKNTLLKSIELINTDSVINFITKLNKNLEYI